MGGAKMRVMVVAIKDTDARKARRGLLRLKRGVVAFRKDLKDSRVDLDTLEDFIEGLRVTANYFERFLDEDNLDKTDT